MLQLISKKNRILVYFLFFILLSTISNKSLNNHQFFLPGTGKIDVSGLSELQNLEISKKINLLLFKNIFFINKDYIHDVISEYNLVDSYKVVKIYPKSIKIEIIPTSFIAQIKKESLYLIGSNGKLIINQSSDRKLPYLFGNFHSQKFIKFKKNIDNSPFKFQDFDAIFFYPSDRWDVRTKNNILIKLPAKNIKEALNIAHQILIDDQFLNKKVIDLRISNQIIIK